MKFSVISFVLINVIIKVSGHDSKSSLSFVIDDTKSMSEEIKQVKLQTNKVFDAVFNSDKSPINEFILITFNDPTTEVRAVTKDRDEFTRALDDIFVSGGGDCPEMALKGILTALEKSAPNSFMYVFTDASAKDYLQFEEVKSLSQKKSIQVSFLLTGMCEASTTKSEDYQVYHKIAIATSGQVFHVNKKNVHKILEYIIESIKSKRTNLVQKIINTGLNEINFNVDSKLNKIIISASGLLSDNISVVDSEGNEIENYVLVDTQLVYVLRLSYTKPGSYKVKINSASKTSVIVSGSTTICFQHGFSYDKPTSIKETSTRPIPGNKSYLSIALTNLARDVELKNAELRDTEDNVIITVPLQLVDSEQQLYVTEQFDPPEKMFKIAINGLSDTKENITRVGLTYIEPQKIIDPSTVDNKAPNVTILGDTKVSIEINKRLTLKCKVKAYPKPEITWENDLGEKFEPEVMTVDLPNDYKSTLDIEKVDKNTTYHCKAKNSEGEDDTEVNVYLTIPGEIAERKGTVDNMAPKVTILGDTEVSTEIDKPLNLKCKVEAFPKPEIIWENDIGEKFEPEVLTVNLPNDYESTLHMEKVDKNTTYYCKAKNSEGKGDSSVYLYLQMPEDIEDPPVIKNVGREMSASDNETIDIECLVEGKPPPDVKWLKNSVEISNGTKYQILRNHTIRFKTSLDDSGNYSCIAKNTFGVAQADFPVYIYAPVSIQIPIDTTIKLMVGSKLTLPCTATGYPEPKVKFTRIYWDPKKMPDTMREGMNTIEMSVRMAQVSHSGNYTCNASNTFSSKSFTYNVIVEAPPYIQDKWDTSIYAVEGDMVLRIPCKARGNPKPNITWMYNGVKINPEVFSAVTDKQVIENDGTLVLTHPRFDSSGSYSCVADNYIDKDVKTYEVTVDRYPEPPENPDKVTKTPLVEGKMVNIKCDIPHSPEDQIIWYKDGKQIKIGELRLDNPNRSDDGMYTCRVSNTSSSHSYHTMVIVGFQPRFITDESDEPIQFIEGSTAFLECSAVAYPEPKAIWTFDGHKIAIPSMLYRITNMKIKHIGVYTCNITNDFGSITRKFRIKSGECQLNIYNDFSGNQPLILTSSWRWPVLETSNGSVIVPIEKPILLFCPGSFLNYPGLERKEKVKAVCIKDSLFNVEGKEIIFSDIKCLRRIEPYIRKNNIPCIRTISELYTIGYKYGSEFLGVYDICFDKRRNVPVFSKHSLHKSISTIIPKNEPEIIASTDMEYNFNELYDHSRQIHTLSSILGKKFESDSCHFSKRQLVNSRDVLPGLSQAATYNYLNIMPHWSPCYYENWEEVEKRVRTAALSLDYFLNVWTGTAGPMRLPDQKQNTDVFLHDTLNQKQFVPLFLWKVVQNFELSGSIAIIQINLPNLTLPQALSYVKCEDICDKIEWLGYDDWHNVKKGYTYCCNIIDFEKKFNYRGLFRGPPSVLSKISNVDKTKY